MYKRQVQAAVIGDPVTHRIRNTRSKGGYCLQSRTSGPGGSNRAGGADRAGRTNGSGWALGANCPRGTSGASSTCLLYTSHNELVKLNLWNPAVVQHQFDAVRTWVEQYDIDGLRLDVAYCLPPEYLRQLRSFTDTLKPDFVLLGETLHGDYNRWMGPDLCHSVTNYECYKGLWSSFNSMNMFEIGHSLARQFGPEPWTLYKGAHLLSFLDNHDVTRIASQLTDRNHLFPAYALIFSMPGVPALYYGSE